MPRIDPTDQTLTVGRAKALFPGLARLLEPLDDDQPLTMARLMERAEPGRPVDRLTALTLILASLGRSRP